LELHKYEPESTEDWLEFRRQHLTSTELAGIHLSKTARAWQEIREQKETGKRWGGNDYTVWGTAREPVLAPLVLDIDSSLEYNADPQTIIINPDDDRLCGTPDLFSADGEVIGEIKTAKHQFTGGRFHDWCPDGYYLQIQANMWHAGAEACVLLVEYYDEEDGEFTPRECESHTILYDRDVCKELELTAADWFAWLEGTTPDWMGEATSLEDADEVEDLVAQLADAEEKASTWSDLAKTYKKDLLKLLGESYAGTHAGYKVSVSTTKDSKTFDSKAFKSAHPDLFAEFNTKTRRGSPRLRLTKVVN